jgi:hypothetical protein
LQIVQKIRLCADPSCNTVINRFYFVLFVNIMYIKTASRKKNLEEMEGIPVAGKLRSYLYPLGHMTLCRAKAYLCWQTPERWDKTVVRLLHRQSTHTSPHSSTQPNQGCKVFCADNPRRMQHSIILAPERQSTMHPVFATREASITYTILSGLQWHLLG